MKVFDVNHLDCNSTGDELILVKAIAYYQKEWKSFNWQYRDARFEQATRAKITYSRIPGKVSHILFEDEDWFWFKAQWL